LKERIIVFFVIMLIMVETGREFCVFFLDTVGITYTVGLDIANGVIGQGNGIINDKL